MSDNFLKGLTEPTETILAFMVYYREGYRLKSAKGKDAQGGQSPGKEPNMELESSSLHGVRIVLFFWHPRVTIHME